MSRSAVLRFVWKEYRTLRAFWIALALITVMGQCLLLVTAQVSATPSWLMFHFAVALAAFYALACGATMFATEREEATYEFLHARPVTNRDAFAGKLMWALVSTAAFGVTVWTVAWILARGQVPEVDTNRRLWWFWGTAAVELLAWGMFFSLLLQSPLKAALLAAASASAVVQCFLVIEGHQGEPFALTSYDNTVGGRLLVAALLMMVNVALGLRWLRPAYVPWKGWFRAATGRTPAPAADVSIWKTPPRRHGLPRLVWHAWRQEARMLGPLVFVAAVTAYVAMWTEGLRAGASAVGVVSAVVAALVGSSIFLGDQQQGRYAFLAEHGVSPRYVWLSRQVVGLGITGMIIAALWNTMGVWLGYSSIILAAYASGQLGSMLCRSGILAGFCGLILTVTVGGWGWLMVFLGMSPLWSVLPIAVVFLVATWLRAPDWILRRNTVRGWTVVALGVLVPMSGIAVAVAMTRVEEIPRTDPGFSLEEFNRPATPAELATAKMYERAYQQFRPIAVESVDGRNHYYYAAHGLDGPLDETEMRWIQDNQESLSLLRRASLRPECLLEDPNRGNPWFSPSTDRFSRFSFLLLDSGRRFENEGNLDAAVDDYLTVLRMANHLRFRGNAVAQLQADEIERRAYGRLIRWSGRDGQSSSLIRRGLVALEQIDARRPSRKEAAMVEYAGWRRVLETDDEALSVFELSEQEVRRLVLMSWFMPWERARALRILNLWTARNLKVLAQTEEVMRTGREPPRSLTSPWIYDADQYSQMWRWLATTPALKKGELYHLWTYNCFAVETWRRAARLVLAIQAWRIEHHKLPETLDVLIDDGIVESVPRDPWSGERFWYYPAGLAFPLRWPRSAEPIAEHTPIVWSTGPDVRTAVPGDEEQEEAWALAPGNQSPVDVSASEAIRHGWAFPIP